MNRRLFLTSTVFTLPTVLSGCMNGPLDGGADRPDPADISIDGRLHNETDSSHTFEVTAETEDGYVLTDDAYEVPGGGTERITAIGVPGATQTFTVAVNGAERSETLTLDVKPTDEALDGYVDITYTKSGEIVLEVVPRSQFSDTDSAPVLTGYTVSDAVATPDVEQQSDMDAWGLFLASRSAADEYFSDIGDNSDEVRAFIQGTAFEDGDRLVYVQAQAPEACYELELGEEPFVATNGLPTIETEANRTASDEEVCAQVITPIELLVRLSFDADGPPADVVTILVNGSAGDRREAFQLDAER